MTYLDARGQATVEAAIITPLLLLLVAGIFVTGLWLNATLSTTAAAREGARVAALTGDCGSVIAGIKKTMDVVDKDLTGEKILVNVGEGTIPKTGEDIKVRVSYQVPVLFGFFKKMYVDNGKDYPFGLAVGEATARMEVDPPEGAANCGG